MPAIQAREEIERGDVPDARVYDVVLAATGSEERAAEALSARLADRLRRNETAEV